MGVSKEQIEKLNVHQREGKYHPLTCMSHRGCNRMEHDEGILIATESGWVCPCGKYTQEFGTEVNLISQVQEQSPLCFMHNDEISEEKLTDLGFTKSGKDHIGRATWRLSFSFEKFGQLSYPFEIDFSWNPKYGKDNPNCGIVSIHSPQQEAAGVPSDLIQKEEWTAEDHERAENYRVTLDEWTQPIAWKVTTMSRLIKIISSITGIKKW